MRCALVVTCSLALLAGCGRAKPPEAARLGAADSRERADARRSLVAQGAGAVPALIAVLSDPDPVAAINSAQALAEIGRPAVPDLVRALESGSGRARSWAAFVLGRIGGDAGDAVPALERAAREPGLRVAAEEALERIRAR